MEECYLCGRELKTKYQVMTYEPNIELRECCSMECAELLRDSNIVHLYEKYIIIKNQEIKVLKK